MGSRGSGKGGESCWARVVASLPYLSTLHFATHLLTVYEDFVHNYVSKSAYGLLEVCYKTCTADCVLYYV